jgi:hypothetical protein
MKRYINMMRWARRFQRFGTQLKLASLASSGIPGAVERYLQRIQAEKRLQSYMGSLGIRCFATWFGLDTLAELGRGEAANDLENARREFGVGVPSKRAHRASNREITERFGV